MLIGCLFSNINSLFLFFLTWISSLDTLTTCDLIWLLIFISLPDIHEGVCVVISPPFLEWLWSIIWGGYFSFIPSLPGFLRAVDVIPDIVLTILLVLGSWRNTFFIFHFLSLSVSLYCFYSFRFCELCLKRYSQENPSVFWSRNLRLFFIDNLDNGNMLSTYTSTRKDIN